MFELKNFETSTGLKIVQGVYTSEYSNKNIPDVPYNKPEAPEQTPQPNIAKGNTMNILNLKQNDCFEVIKVNSGSEIGKRLADMGFTRGANGWIVRSALFGDPIQVNIRNYNVSIRRSEAEKVEVAIL